MTIQEFVDLVSRMRAAQKVYFRDRTPYALSQSKQLERAVDEAVREISQTEKQASLF